MSVPSKPPKPRNRGKKGEPTKPQKAEPSKKAWDTRDWPKRGDAKERSTFAAMGNALSAWNEIEVELTKLFMLFCEGNGGYRGVAVRAFGAVRSFEARLEMFKAALEPFFAIEHARVKDAVILLAKHDEQAKLQYGIEWLEKTETDMRKMCSNAKEFVSRRNEMAHGIVSTKFGSFKAGTKQGYVLQPAPMDKKSNMFSMPSFAYSSKELLYYSEEFKKISAGALRLNVHLRVLREEIRQIEREHNPEPL